MATARAEDVIELPNAGVPADHGLSSLGLLMQLAGSAFAAIAGLLAVLALVAPRLIPGGSSGGVLVVLGLCVARSLYHRQAGTELLYGRKRPDGTAASPLAGVQRYAAAALAQTALVALVLYGMLGVPGVYVLGYGLGLAVWPLVLQLALGSGQLARFEAAIPYGEDKGFEGASILMVVLGACGVIASCTALLAALGRGPRDLEGGAFLAATALGVLAIRSCLHVRAGLSGLRETSIDHSVDRANRYASFGVISSFCAGGAWLLAETSLPGIALIAGACWLLLLWPLIVRRFFCDRQFADLLAGERAALHRRAPDAGLTGLGWLLVGHAALTASFLLPRLVAPLPPETGVDWLLALAGGLGDGSPWWTASVLVLELWAGYELVRMGPLHRIVTIGYGAAAALVTLYLMWPLLGYVAHPRALAANERLVIALAVIASQLVIPISAVLLAGRRVAPAARARYRRGARKVYQT